MTDNLHYQDVFQTNIPKLERNVTLHAEYLLHAANNQDFEDPEITKYRRSSIDSAEVTQAIWELKGDNGRVQRLMAITAGGGAGFRIGLDRRPTADTPEAYRKSLFGDTYVFDSDPRSEGFHGTGNEEEVQRFYDTFYDTVAALGLKHRLLQEFGTQREAETNNSEQFAQAA